MLRLASIVTLLAAFGAAVEQVILTVPAAVLAARLWREHGLDAA